MLKVTEVLDLLVAEITVAAPVTVLVKLIYAKPFESSRRVPFTVTDPILVLAVEMEVREGEALAFR